MIHAIQGPNFSGRSFYMQCYSGFPVDRVRQAIKSNDQLFRDNRNDLYIGAIPDYFFTGFFSTVESEIFRFQEADPSRVSILKEFLDRKGLSDLYPRNPFSLSGGEKAVISTLSYVISNPRTLCIDCTLEQLSQEWKVDLLTLLLSMSLPEVILADNRLVELPASLHTGMRFTAITEQHPVEMDLRDMAAENLNLSDVSQNHKLEVSNLSFSYGKKPLFKQLNFQFETGKIYHLRGPNGAGKSTLSKILSGVIKPGQSGDVYFDQNKVFPYSHPGKIVGYTFQQPDDQLFSKTVREELGIFGKKSSGNSELQSVIETFGLMPLLDLHPFELPVSMRKRLSIASALSVQRPFYIFDEPTLYLDDTNVTELRKVLNKLVSSGRGIVLISHSANFANSFDSIQTLDLNQS